jgi:fructose-bisphosphate aldolase class II
MDNGTLTCGSDNRTPADVRLETLSTQFRGRIPTCAHGTDELPDSMFKEMIVRGVTKVSSGGTFRSWLIRQINVNSWVRDPYMESLAAGFKSKPFPDAVEDATKVVMQECERFFKLFGSENKA